MYKNSIYLLFIVIILASCTGNKLRVKKTNFDQEVLRAQNLVFIFNKELLNDSSRINKWDSIGYLHFEPAIPGKFMWTGKNELTFSPLGLMAPATDYKAFLNTELLRYVKKDYNVDKDPVAFHTPYLSIDGVNSYWALGIDPAAHVEVRLQLTFNNPVSPAKLKGLLKIQVRGKEVPYNLLSQSDGEIMELSVGYDALSPDETAGGKVSVGKGMVCQGGNSVTTSELEHSFMIPSKDKLEISEITTGFDKGKGMISVFTTQPILALGLAGFISTEPAVVFQTELLPNGFMITGDFSEKQAYTVKIAPALKSVFGRELGQEYIQTVTFGSLEPYVGFTEKNATYLSSKGFRNLGISIINVPSVKVSVFKIFENNIQHYLRQGKTYNYVEDNDEYHDLYGYSFDENFGKPVMSKIVQTRSLQKSGNISLLNLDLDEMQFNDSFKGMFLIKVESTDRKWLQDIQLLSLSDLGVIVKEGTDDVMVFVNSLKDASPMKGARLEFISSNNQKVYSTATDNNGVAIFKNVKQNAAGFKLSMVTAKYGNDFNFILFNNSRVETSRFDVGGKRTANFDYDVFIYGDRNLYRPGDTVHVNTIVRTLKWETVRDIPVKIRLIAPNGKEYLTQRRQLGNYGAAETTFNIPRQAMTGTYLIEVYSANNVLLASSRISVEEFIPDRIKVSVKTAKNVYQAGEAVTVDLLAENLFGTAAIGRKCETELRLTRKNISPPAFPDFNFKIQTKNMPVLANIIQQGITDGKGKASQVLQPAVYKEIGLLDGTIFTTVFDETGRPVNRINKVDIPTQQVFFGIRNFDTWLSTRKPLNFQFVAVDQTGKAVSAANARVVISQYRYETVIERGYNRYNYVSQKKETVMFSKDMSISGKGTVLPFIPSRSGEYEVKIMLPGSDNYVSATFYAYGWGDTDYSSFEVSREGEITITADKPVYNPGEKARLLFKSPFDGQLLVAYEQNNVLEYKYLSLKNKSASLDLNIIAAQLPNVYIDATAFRKTSDEFIPLTVAHGVISLKVEDPHLKLNVSIKAAEKSRSGVKQLITVNTLPNAEVTIAVVDEGILQVTDYKSPDPFNWFYQKRALEVNSYDVYGQLYPEMRSGSSMAGGEAFDLARRINPLTGTRVKLISKWSGLLKSNSSGVCSYMLDIPQFSGTLRVMAVAYKDNQFGSSEHFMKVADPVVISMALPRFMSPGDKSTVAVTLTNTTATACNSSVQMSASGPATVAGVSSSKVNLVPGKEQVLTFDVLAANSVGNASVTVLVTAMGQKFSQQITVPVRPASGLAFITGSGAIQAGSKKSFKVESDLILTGIKSKMILSKSPVAKFTANLNYLLRYPYGCLEQTVSTAFPQIYFRDMVKLLGSGKEPGSSDYGNPDYNVQQAITKVESMQLYNGGYSLWADGGNAQYWASAYGTHFLLEAKTAGFEVNEKVLDGSLRFLEQKVKERETNTWFYYENNVLKSRTVPRQEIFYSLYVLALANRPIVSTMNFYKSQLSSLAPDSRYLLAASYMLAGDRKSYQAVLPGTFGSERAEAMTGGSFSSYLRDMSVSLNALLEADPNNPQVGELMRMVTEELNKPNRYYSTQENAFALLAIGKQAKKAAASTISAQVNVDGKPVATFTNSDLQLNTDIANKMVTVAAKGTGTLYYYYELSGIRSKSPSGSEDSYLKVRKKFFDRDGREISGNSFNQNDLVVVEIAAEAPAGKTIENVAITDLLPACFEIENSRLVAEREMSWMKPMVTPEYIDVRDDRISFFTPLTGKVRYFYYTVRVVSRGAFTLGPITADAMYNGLYHSYSGSGSVIVK